MKGQELKIIFRGNMAFLTDELALDFQQVELPDPSATFKAPAFWTIRVINYREADKRLFVEVLTYEVGETTFSYNQVQLADTLVEVEKVGFKSIDTGGWLTTLNSITPKRFSPPKPETVYRPEMPVATARNPVKAIYNDPFSIAINDVKFISGGVEFEKKIQPLKKSVKFFIANEHIIEAYDAIKNYFSNVLKTKKFLIVPGITTIDGAIDSIVATSADIDKIDPTLIEEVKFEWAKVAAKKEAAQEEHLLTLETLADETLTAEQLFQDEKEFMENLLKHSGTKHYHHLRFLSARHQHTLQKLQFIQQPFSFLFLLKSNDALHMVWETLNTEEATYVWTFIGELNNVKEIVAGTGKIINGIISNGKNEYINRKENNFHRVFHDYSDPHNGFKNWKEEIEKIIL